MLSHTEKNNETFLLAEPDNAAVQHYLLQLNRFRFYQASGNGSLANRALFDSQNGDHYSSDGLLLSDREYLE